MMELPMVNLMVHSLGPDLGTIEGNPLGSNDGTKLRPLLGKSEGISYDINDDVLHQYLDGMLMIYLDLIDSYLDYH